MGVGDHFFQSVSFLRLVGCRMPKFEVGDVVIVMDLCSNSCYMCKEYLGKLGEIIGIGYVDGGFVEISFGDDEQSFFSAGQLYKVGRL